MSEDKKTVPLRLRIPEEIDKKLKKLADEKFTSKSEIARQGLIFFLNNTK